MVGMLSAIPKTPLHDRLAKAGRLDPADESEFGTNVIPLNLSRAELRNGYIDVMHAIYQPAAFFERLDALNFEGHLTHGQLGMDKYKTRHPWMRVKHEAVQAVIAIVLAYRLFSRVKEKGLRLEYVRRAWRALTAGLAPSSMTEYLHNCAMHYHYYKLVQDMRAGRLANTF
jgi:hypothetical protein